MKKNFKKNNQFEEMICTTEYPVDMAFTPEELAEKRELLVDNVQAVDTVKLQKKESVQGYNERLSGIENEIRKLCNEIQKKAERRMEKCKVRYDFDKGFKYILHPQTGEILKSIEIDLEDHAMYEEWKKSKKKYEKPIVFALTAGEVIDVKDENKKEDIPNNNDENEEGEDNE